MWRGSTHFLKSSFDADDSSKRVLREIRQELRGFETRSRTMGVCHAGTYRAIRLRYRSYELRSTLKHRRRS